MSKTMAAVLAAHSDYIWRTGTGWECVCGQRILAMSVGAGEFFAQHQADTLTGAGFGDVREAVVVAKALALEEVAGWLTPLFATPIFNSYQRDLLVREAAAVRGEG